MRVSCLYHIAGGWGQAGRRDNLLAPRTVLYCTVSLKPLAIYFCGVYCTVMNEKIKCIQNMNIYYCKLLYMTV